MGDLRRAVRITATIYLCDAEVFDNSISFSYIFKETKEIAIEILNNELSISKINIIAAIPPLFYGQKDMCPGVLNMGI
jgi:hypothetical protein